jgi:pyruvate kinase
MNQFSPDSLLERVVTLRADVRRESEAIFAHWRDTIANRRTMPAARNLAAYLALRRHDISDLQPALAALGVSSLGRSEAHAMASLDALCATLARIAGVPGYAYPPPGRMVAGGRTLRRMQALFFGQNIIGATTRIMVTLPTEAATDEKLVRALIEAGMTCARINCAHDDADTWRAMAHLVRTQAAAAKTECRILMDIGGPKCRIETIHFTDKVRVFRGDRIVIVRELAQAVVQDDVVVTITFPDILKSLSPGKEVWINDGKIGTRVVAAIDGERLRVEKGLNFPETELHLNPLTPRDLDNLDGIASLADLVGFSFVQRPQDLKLLHDELSRRRPGQEPMPVMLKIETPLAVRNLPRLIVLAAAAGPVAVMIARGDLAVELGYARLSEIQEEIMWLCEAAYVPVVWATQVLDGLISNGIPSRAEATDAAMAQRAECVMLNKGPFLPEGIRFLADVLRRMDRHQDKKSARFGPLHSWPAAELGLDPVRDEPATR